MRGLGCCFEHGVDIIDQRTKIYLQHSRYCIIKYFLRKKRIVSFVANLLKQHCPL